MVKLMFNLACILMATCFIIDISGFLSIFMGSPMTSTFHWNIKHSNELFKETIKLNFAIKININIF